MAVVERAQAKGVDRFLIPGTTPPRWQRQLAMGEQTAARLDLAVGLHPYFLPENPGSALEQLAGTLSEKRHKVVAVGEIGIDAAIDASLELQQAVFEEQLDLAATYQLPVILHHRRSHHLLIASLKRSGFARGGIVHAFSGSRQVADEYIALGFKLGIGGTITYPRANKTRETVTETDISHLVLETDSPDMPVSGKQGVRNEPANLPSVARELASLKGYTVAEIDQLTSANYCSLFGR